MSDRALGILQAACIYSPHDREVAEALSQMLVASEAADVDVERGLLDAGASFQDRMDARWHAGLTIVLLSPQSVPRHWIGEQWQRCLWTEPEESGVLVCAVQTGPCHVPDLMRRPRPGYRFFDAQADRRGALVAIRRWIFSTSRGLAPPRFIPSDRVRVTESAHLDQIAQAIVEKSGTLVIEAAGAAGKTDLACEFTRRFLEDFEDVCWISCAGRSLAELTGDLAACVDMPLYDDAVCSAHKLRNVIEPRRWLIVLDGVDSPEALALVPGGRASCLVTSRLAFDLPGLRLPPGDPPATQGKASVLAVCRPDALLPELLATLDFNAPDFELLDRASGLVRSAGSIDSLELPSEVRAELELRHAQAVLSLVKQDAHPRLLGDLMLAVRRLVSSAGHASLAADLARRGEQMCRAYHRTPERVELLQLVAEAAWLRGDHERSAAFAGDLVGILDDWNRPGEADVWRSRIYQSTHSQLAFPFLVEAHSE